MLARQEGFITKSPGQATLESYGSARLRYDSRDMRRKFLDARTCMSSKESKLDRHAANIFSLRGTSVVFEVHDAIGEHTVCYIMFSFENIHQVKIVSSILLLSVEI